MSRRGHNASRPTAFVAPSAPTVTSASPSSGTYAGGVAVTITGTLFRDGCTVTFGGTAATSVVRVNSTTITCVTPAKTAGAKNVVATNPDAQTGTGTNAFTYLGVTISGVSPSSGGAGTAITITGTQFKSGAAVTVGGVAATSIVVVSATSITCVAPAGSGSADVVVTNTDGGTATSAAAFSYFDPSSLSLTGWWKPDYSASPWVGQASAGNSNTHSLSEATHPPTTGTAINGHVPAHFDGVNLRLGGVATNAIVAAAAWSVSGVVNGLITSGTAYYLSAQPYYDQPIIGDVSNGNFGVARSKNGSNVDVLTAFMYDGVSYNTVAVACSNTVGHFFHAWYDGTNINLSVDGGAPSQIASGHYTAAAGAYAVGAGFSNLIFLTGNIAELIVSNTDLGGAARTNLTSYFQAKYGL